MNIYIEPERSQWEALTRRVRREDAVLEERVGGILRRIREGGDAALREVIGSIEGWVPASLQVGEEAFREAEAAVPEALKSAIREAYDRIRTFHEMEIPSDSFWDDGAGIVCRRRFLPIRRVGLYIPGGTAPLFSTVLMLGIPAGIAGCPERILCTPPGKDGRIAPALLYAARLCGIDTVYQIGGAQAIAAMAYGTASIPKVDKVFGPGNRYVLQAKQQVAREGMAIDMPAGPPEVMVLADETADIRFIAADLLSQAEHGPDSQVLLVCPDRSMAEAVLSEVGRQKALFPREGIVDAALSESRIIVLADLADRIDFANTYAPEHLILSVRDPEAVAEHVTAAGSVFLGAYSPESAGDYASGTNHTLPTVGLATAWSGLGVEQFMHAITYQSVSCEGLSRIGGAIVEMARAEGLDAHANAVRVRLAASRTSCRDEVGDTEPEGLLDDRFAVESEERKGEGPERSEGGSGTSTLSQKPAPRHLVRENIRDLEPYSTARDEYQGELGILLDANENPFQREGLNRYPAHVLRRQILERIAALKGVSPDRVFLGNGSDESIDLCYRVFCRPGIDNALMIAPSYGMYRVCADTNDIEARPVQLNPDFSLPVERLLAAADEHSKLLFLCSPNNPTANAFPESDIRQLLERFGGMVVLDEAYVDFSEKGSLVPLLDEYPNLIILQTLSKAWGLAGLRIGITLTAPWIITLFDRVRYPYNIGTDTLAMAARFLDPERAKKEIAMIREERDRLAARLKEFPFIGKVFPSDANFLLIQTPDPKGLYTHLLSDGIIVRDRSTTRGCGPALRLTVGTPEENEKIIQSLTAYGRNQ